MTMPLSEAMRIGAMLNPQAVGAFKDESGATCAMGAACEAIGLCGLLTARYGSISELIPAEWHRVLDYYAELECPGFCNGNFRFVSDVIMHLNDVHQWSRENIANWVQSMEELVTLRSTPVRDFVAVEQEAVNAVQ